LRNYKLELFFQEETALTETDIALMIEADTVDNPNMPKEMVINTVEDEKERNKRR
jgi:hypothetical protein